MTPPAYVAWRAGTTILCRGRILGQNPVKSHKSFPPFYSQSPLQLCFLYFCSFKPTQPLAVSVKENGGKPDRKPFPLPHGLRNPYRNLKSENSTFMNSKVHFIPPVRDSEFRYRGVNIPQSCSKYGCRQQIFVKIWLRCWIKMLFIIIFN